MKLKLMKSWHWMVTTDNQQIFPVRFVNSGQY